MRHFGALAVTGLVCLAAAGQGRAAAEARDRAGFAEVEITPPVGIDLGGRGCSDEASTELLDPLFAQATVLEDGRGRRLVVVSLDLIGLGRRYGEELRRRIADRLGVPPAHILLNCSHTHSGPMMYREAMAACGEPKDLERRYLSELADKVEKVCLTAAGRLRPVLVSVCRASCDVGINRRNRTADGSMAMRPNAEGPRGREVWCLRLDSGDGRLRGVLFSCPCHPVIVYSYARRGISGEFPSVARRELRAAFGADLHTQFLQGCAGNIRPRVTADLEKGRFHPTKPADTLQAGRDLARAVSAALAQPPRRLSLDLAARSAGIELLRGQPPSRSYYERIAKGEGHRARAARYWLDGYDRGGPATKTASWQAGVVRLASDQWICWLAGEPVVQWEALIKKWFGECPVCVLGYTQQVVGYLPVDEILDEGGYEVDSSNHFRAESPAPFARGLNEVIRRSLLEQVADIEKPAASRP